MSYELTGRRQQKSRTRDALIDAARRLLADGVTPTVDLTAAAANASRATAYRYFPSQEALLAAANPETEQASLLPAGAPEDPHERLDCVLSEFFALMRRNEAQLRAALRRSLSGDHEVPVLRQGRAVVWIEDALSPLREDTDVHELAVAIRAAVGVEACVWLVDVAGLSWPAAHALVRRTAHALVRDRRTR